MNPVFDIAAFRFDDPFGPSADPARYVPREATERALAQLAERAIEQRSSALLAGVPGIGKTLLLRILLTRFGANTRVVHLRYPALPAGALFAWALHELDGPNSYDPVGALVSLAAQRANQGGDIVLLVDDAETLPDDAAVALYGACAQAGGALRFIAAGDRESMGRLAGHVHESNPILLVEPMSQDETNAYIAAHLAACGLTAAAGNTFDSAALARLHAHAGGIPARVNAEASRMLRQALGPQYVAPTPEPAASVEPAAATPRPTATHPTATAPTPIAAAARPKPAAPATKAVPAASDATAALERAAGRLALAQQKASASGPVDAALERAAGRLALANAAHDPAAGAESSAPANRAAAARRGAIAQPAPPPDTAAAVASHEAASKQGRRRQPPLSLAAGLFLGFLAAGALFGVRLLDATVDRTPEQRAETLKPPQAIVEPLAPPPVSAPPPPPPPRIPVQINARPWAEIYIDGTIVGVTPLAGVMLTPGPHEFEARFPNGELETHTLEIDDSHRHLAFPLPAPAEAGSQ